jgi:hypothetical protein
MLLTFAAGCQHALGATAAKRPASYHTQQLLESKEGNAHLSTEILQTQYALQRRFFALGNMVFLQLCLPINGL